jgi:DNA repair protein RadD
VTAPKKELLPRECPKCSLLMAPKTRKCLSCGFEPKPISEVEVREGDLHEITRSKKQKVRDWTISRKQEFYSELLLHAYMRGYKNGWAYYAYKDKTGSFPPNTLSKTHAKFVSMETTAWIKHYNIKKARSKYGLGSAA